MEKTAGGSSYWFLTWELTRTEFKLRDQGTALGFLWTLLHPALIFLVLHELFINWLGQHVDKYAAYLVIGIVQWQFFEKATSISLSSLLRKANLVRNFKFPREIIILSSVGAVFISSALEFLVLLLFLSALGIKPAFSWLWVFPLSAVHLLLILGVSFTLSLLALRIRDLERVWGVLMMAGFYLTPVFYPLSIISDERRKYLDINPLLHIIEGFRWALIGSAPPSILCLSLTAAAGTGLLVFALSFVRKNEAWISERVMSS